METKSKSKFSDRGVFLILDIKTTEKLSNGQFNTKLYITKIGLVDDKFVVGGLTDVAMPLNAESLYLYYSSCYNKTQAEISKIEAQIEKYIDDMFLNPKSPLKLEVAEMLNIDAVDIYTVETTVLQDKVLILFDGEEILGSKIIKKQYMNMYVDPKTGAKAVVCGSHYDKSKSGDLYLVDVNEAASIQPFRFNESPLITSMVYRNPHIKNLLGTESRDDLLNYNNWTTIELTTFSIVEIPEPVESCTKLTIKE